MGDFGAFAIVLAAAFSIAGNNFQGGVSLPRMTYGMARQGMLPRWFAHVSPRWQTPSNSILFYGGAGIAFGLWEGFEALALAGTLTRLFTYLVSAAALPVLERRDGALNPVHAVVAGLAFISTGWVASHANPQSWLTFGGLFLLGTLFYFIAARQAPLDSAAS